MQNGHVFLRLLSILNEILILHYDIRQLRHTSISTAKDLI